MFSQFRQAVESLAPLPRSSLDGQPEDTRRDSDLSRSNSLDSPLNPSSPMSSSQLAESALHNLRKSLATQRSGNTGSLPKTASPTPPREVRTKSRIEDRLRAATSVIGEPSRSPEVIRKASPSLASTASNHPLSSDPPPLPDASLESDLSASLDKTNTETADKLVNNSDVMIPETEPTTTSPPTNLEESAEKKEVQVEGQQSPHSTSSLHAATDNLNNTQAPEATPTPPDVLEDYPPAAKESKQPLAYNSSLKVLESESGTDKEMLPHIVGVVASADAKQEPAPSGTETTSNEIATLPVTAIDCEVAGRDAHIEELQEKLRLVEQRFTDVSISFKRLQEEKQAADLVLQELTPLETVHDNLALREYFKGLTSKTEVFQDEIKRLNSKLETQEDRFEELRDTHRLETSSQSLQVEKLRTQLSETEALLNAANSADAQVEEVTAGHKAEIVQLQKELERVKLLAKEEEEKRVKAISLLKTVRQKLVKAEKEKEEAIGAVALAQEKERSERERDQVERSRLRSELDASNLDKEKALAGLKGQFDKEMTSFRDRCDKELASSKTQYEAEITSIKTVHTQEISARDTQTRALQQSLSLVTIDKNAFFDDLQMRQAELESAQSHLESLESQKTEYQYQLRELNDRYALLKDDFAEAQRDQEARAREPTTSSDEVARLLSATESKYESKLFDLKKNLVAIEKERNDSEAEWSRKLRDKTREVEDFKRLAGSVAKAEEQHEEVVRGLRANLTALEEESRLLKEQLQELAKTSASVRESEKSWKSQEQGLNSKIATLEQLVEEYKQRESQLRAGNKTLREELRKVQSSAALLERQRNPGVGYWISRSAENNPTASQLSVNTPSSEIASRVSSPDPSSRQKTGNDEEVNLEYLRNVILQFLEHKEMRPNLVKVLSIILHFTPQETRRLVAKV